MAKYQIIYRKNNNGVTICDIEKIDKYTVLRESGENRFDIKVQIEKSKKDVINFVYTEKLYISPKDAKEIVNEFLKQY